MAQARTSALLSKKRNYSGTTSRSKAEKLLANLTKCVSNVLYNKLYVAVQPFHLFAVVMATYNKLLYYARISHMHVLPYAVCSVEKEIILTMKNFFNEPCIYTY